MQSTTKKPFAHHSDHSNHSEKRGRHAAVTEKLMIIKLTILHMDTQNHLGHVHHTIIPLHTEYQQKTYNFLGGCLTEDGKI